MPSESREIKKKVNRGLAWVGLASSMVGVLDIVAHIVILAFWISKEQFGIAMLAVSLFPILDLATDMGLSAAVIQRDDHTEDRISTVFWLNMFMSLIMFAALALLIGPGLSSLQGSDMVGLLLTVYGTKLIWQNIYFMPQALMRRELRFKELSVIRMLANIAEFVGKVGGAAIGLGVWCFVVGPLMRVFVTGVGTQILYPWRPKFVLKVREALSWAAFGFKTSAHQILFQIYTNLDYQVVGYFFGKEANGIYSVAYLIVLEPAKVIGEVIIQIAFPTFARLKRSKDKLVDQFIAFTRMNLVVMIAFLGVILVPAADLLGVFWGDKYLAATTTLQVLCAVGVLRALSFVVPPLLDGVGKPTLTLIYTIVASVVVPGCFVLFAWAFADDMPAGEPFLSVALAWAVGYPVAFAVLLVLGLRQIKLSAWQYIRRTIGIPLCAVVAVSASFGVRYLVGDGAPPVVRLLASAGTMLTIFFVLLARFQGISPRTVVAALSDDKKPPEAAGGEDESAAD